MLTVVERLKEVRDRIAQACQKAGRRLDEVSLVAVSKTQSAESVRCAYDAGQRIFGENYAQEFASKAAELSHLREIDWHFIGHVQSNKAKILAEWAGTVESVGTLSALRALAKQLQSRNRPPLPILVEVNVGGEAQKQGVPPDDLAQFFDAIHAEPSVRLSGLMTVPPAGSRGLARRAFDTLAELRHRHGGVARLPHLSMGMSGDFEEAIDAGSTIVRVGTAIFGPRG